MKFKSLLSLALLTGKTAYAVSIGQAAPLFALKDQNGVEFSLEKNKDKVWSVLYFYPKAETPGCTKQACAFRDSLKVIEKENALVYGISTDSVENLKKFEVKYKLQFRLLSDSDATVCKLYGTKMPILPMSKRHTFIVDPNLIVRYIETDVDPALDAKRVAEKIRELQAENKKTESKK